MATNIVFDFGAVLFTWQPHLLVHTLFPEEAPTPAAASELAAAIFHHEDWLSFDGGAIEPSSVTQRITHRLGLRGSGLQELMARIPEHLSPMPETVALLERLVQRRARDGDIRLYFLSNMPALFARELERRHAFLAWFDGGVFSGDVKLVKPQPEIFQLLQKRYALDPAHTVFIDDLAANAQAARDHGWRGIHFESAARLEADLKSFGI